MPALPARRRVLRAANLGDSGFLIVRDGQVFFHSPSQQHRFNMPFQIGPFGEDSVDQPEDSERFQLAMHPGDIIVAGTDGVFDNAFDEEILSVVLSVIAKDAKATPGQVAQALALLARRHAEDGTFNSPFAVEAAKAGYRFQGGKLDDITVVVSFCRTEADVSLPAKL